MGEPRDHHYAPQFFLRNFASDEARSKVFTVGKSGDVAVWSERSIQSVGHDRDFYVSTVAGVPISVESDINARVETPLSRSPTWAKIASGNSAELDASDKPTLYALIRHLEVRSPHFLNTQMELAELAADPHSDIAFSDEERAHFAFIRRHPEVAKGMVHNMAATINWSEAAYNGSGLSICRSPIPLSANRSDPSAGRRPSAPPPVRLRLPATFPSW